MPGAVHRTSPPGLAHPQPGYKAGLAPQGALALEQPPAVSDLNGSGGRYHQTQPGFTGAPNGRQHGYDGMANNVSRSFPSGAQQTTAPPDGLGHSDPPSLRSPSFQGLWDIAAEKPSSNAERPPAQHSYPNPAPSISQTRGAQAAAPATTWTGAGQGQAAYGQGARNPGSAVATQAAANPPPSQSTLQAPPPAPYQQHQGPQGSHRSAAVPPAPSQTRAPHPNNPTFNTATAASANTLHAGASGPFIMEDPSQPVQKTKNHKRQTSRVNQGNPVPHHAPPPGPAAQERSSYSLAPPPAQGLLQPRAQPGPSSGQVSQSSSASSLQARGYPPATFSSQSSAAPLQAADPNRLAGGGHPQASDQSQGGRFQLTNNLVATQWHSLGVDGVVSSPWQFDDIGSVDLSNGTGTGGPNSQQAFNFGEAGMVGGQNQAKRMFGMAFGEDLGLMSQPQNRMRTN